jgi:hypothetical protein
MNSINRELIIHAWGGIGSQLFAVALLKDLQKVHPKRKMVILLHTGGVTRRVPEVVELFPEISFNYKDDYSVSRVGSNVSTSNLRMMFAPFLRQLFSLARILQSCNDDSSFQRVNFWTRLIRGHYSYRTISKEFLELLNTRIQSNTRNVNIDSELCSIHYRLGDLLLLEDKHPIAPEAILCELERLSNIFNFSKIEIYSDSPSQAYELLNPNRRLNIITHEADPVSVMARAIQSEYFLGTSSKVSFWIVAIRSVIFEKQSSIPAHNFREISGLLNKDLRRVNLYDA